MAWSADVHMLGMYFKFLRFHLLFFRMRYEVYPVIVGLIKTWPQQVLYMLLAAYPWLAGLGLKFLRWWQDPVTSHQHDFHTVVFYNTWM